MAAYACAMHFAERGQDAETAHACVGHGRAVGYGLDDPGPPYRMLLLMRPALESVDCADGTSFAVDGRGRATAAARWK